MTQFSKLWKIDVHLSCYRCCITNFHSNAVDFLVLSCFCLKVYFSFGLNSEPALVEY